MNLCKGLMGFKKSIQHILHWKRYTVAQEISLVK